MNKIKEKQLLVKWSKAMNEPIDPVIVEEVERYEQLQKEIIESVKQNSIRDLVEASAVAEQLVEKVNIEFPKPPTLEELLEVLKEETNELVQTQTTEEPTPPAETKTTSLADLAAEHITKEVQHEQASFQQPNPPVIDKNLQAIQLKLKFLEQAIGKIAAHGPGSGETRFLRLDDVNYQSWQDRDRHKILKYEPNSNSAYDGVTFGFLTGDQGPIYSLKFDEVGYTGNANVAAGLVAWNNTDDCLDVYQGDNTILQVGLENYIKVHNHTGNTLTNGTFVQFSGIDSDSNYPLVVPYLNDVNNQPLYAVGVLTTDLQDNTNGRATVLGYVRNLDTTGNTVGETWQAGDLLWADDKIPGRLTKNKPSAPNVSISVAAVTTVDSTNGVILVRPTIWPRFYSGDFYSTQTQIAPNANFAHKVTFSNTLFTSGVTRNSSTFSVAQSGYYRFDIRLQLTSTNSSAKSLTAWLKKNNVNVPYSSVRKSVSENGGYAVMKFSQALSLEPTDNVEVYYAVTDTAIYIDSPAPIDGSANTASVQMLVTQPSL